MHTTASPLLRLIVRLGSLVQFLQCGNVISRAYFYVWTTCSRNHINTRHQSRALGFHVNQHDECLLCVGMPYESRLGGTKVLRSTSSKENNRSFPQRIAAIRRCKGCLLAHLASFGGHGCLGGCCTNTRGGRFRRHCRHGCQDQKEGYDQKRGIHAAEAGMEDPSTEDSSRSMERNP